MGFTYTEDFIKALVQSIVLGTGLHGIWRLLLFDEEGNILNNPSYYNWETSSTSSGLYISGRAKIVRGGYVKRISAPIFDNLSLFYFHYILDEPVFVDENTEPPVSMNVIIEVPLTVVEGVGTIVNMLPFYVSHVLARYYHPSVLKPRYLKVYGDGTVSGNVNVEMLSQTKCVIRGNVRTPSGFSVKSIAVANSYDNNLIVIIPPDTNYGTVEVEIEVGV